MKKNITKIVVAIVFFVALGFQLFHNGENDEVLKTHTSVLNPEEHSSEKGGISLRYYDDKNTLTPKNLTHIINDTKTYTPKIEIGNNYSTKSSYGLFFYLDYKQTTVKFQNKDNYYVDLTLNPFETQTIQIELPDLSVTLGDNLHLF